MATESTEEKLTNVPPHVPPECVIELDFNDIPGADEDVHLAWKQLQKGAPVQWTPYYGGHWIVTRAPLIQEVQKDFAHFSHTVFSLPRRKLAPMPPIDLDPPEHTPLRAILNLAFSPKVVERLKPQIRELVIELTERLKTRGECEFVSDFARQFPITVFLQLVDLPLSLRPQFLEWAEQMVRGTPEERVAVFPAIDEYLRGVVTERYANPGVDVISQILTSRVGERRITFEEGLGMNTLLFLGGLDTVASMLSFITRHLAMHDAQRRDLAAHPEKIGRAVEELLRRHGLSNTVRLITEDYDFHGYPLKKNELMMVPISLAGLDDEYWENAEEVDFDRETKFIDTFGNGPHKCPGSNLARTEIAVFLEEWLKRIPDFHIPEGKKSKTVTGSVPCVSYLPLEWPVTA